LVIFFFPLRSCERLLCGAFAAAIGWRRNVRGHDSDIFALRFRAVCSLRPGKVVIVLRGRFAGRKAVVLRNTDSTDRRPYGHAVVAGIDRYPLRVRFRALVHRPLSARSAQPLTDFGRVSGSRNRLHAAWV
jgi:hypothetical protein